MPMHNVDLYSARDLVTVFMAIYALNCTAIRQIKSVRQTVCQLHREPFVEFKAHAPNCPDPYRDGVIKENVYQKDIDLFLSTANG